MVKPEEERSGKKRLGTGWKVAIAVGVVVVAVAAAAGIYAVAFISASGGIKVGSVDLAKIPDGTYTASYGVMHVKATVKVAVSNHRITRVEVTRMPSGGEEGVPGLVERVVREQRLDVDTVSGASMPTSQKVTLKAIEKALTQQ